MPSTQRSAVPRPRFRPINTASGARKQVATTPSKAMPITSAGSIFQGTSNEKSPFSSVRPKRTSELNTTNMISKSANARKRPANTSPAKARARLKMKRMQIPRWKGPQ